jgi:glycosyltransferase involved in cell wall biosynthesis
MDILIGNNHLHTIGGTEMFTYSLAHSLVKLGHSVEYFTFNKGIVSERMERDLGVTFMSKQHYDAIIVNHNTVVEFIKRNDISGHTIQTCHGILSLEQPSPLADSLVFISEQLVKDAISTAKILAEREHVYLYNLLKCKIIWNGINTDRFYPIKPLNEKLTHILSLSQSDLANEYIKQACGQLNVELITRNKFTNATFDVYEDINNADLVIGVGRSAYDAMACGRAVVAFDWRSYNASPMGVGYINRTNIFQSMYTNLTGRPDKYAFTSDNLISQLCEAISKYRYTDGNEMRQFAVQWLNMDTHAQYYIDIATKS